MKVLKILFSSLVLSGVVALVSSSLIIRNLPPEPEKPYIEEHGDRGNTMTYTIKATTRIRSCYTFNLFNEGDQRFYNFFKDTIKYNVGSSLISSIYDDSQIHLNIEDDSGEMIKLSYNGYEELFIGNRVVSFILNKQLEPKEIVDILYVKKDVVEHLYFSPTPNTCETQEFTRKLFTAKYTDGEVISIDGIKDNKYKEAQTIKIDCMSRHHGETKVTAEASILWDDEYLYCFFEVKDPIIDDYTPDPHPGTGDWFENDSCELWISTCRSLPFGNQTWGYEGGNRPIKDYCGEGGFKIRAGHTHINGGQEWMYDKYCADTSTCAASSLVISEDRYNAEFKINLFDFNLEKYCADKENQIIDIGLLVDDGEENVNRGKVGSNDDSTYVWNWGGPSHMDHLRLVK